MLLSVLLCGCASTNLPQPLINAVIFGGEPSFVHDPSKLLIEEVNSSLRKHINKTQEKILNPH